MNTSKEAKAAESAQLLEKIHKETLSPATARTTEELKQANESFDPMNAPAGLYGLYFPLFVNGIEKLSNKSLKRVINALMAYPLEDVYPYKKNQLENQVYQIGLKLMDAKYLMIMATAYEAENKRLEKLASEQAVKDLAEKSVESPVVVTGEELIKTEKEQTNA